jgi:hypothetical protein
MGSLKHDTGKSSKTADRLEQSTNVLCGPLHATNAYAYSRTAATNLPFKAKKKKKFFCSPLRIITENSPNYDLLSPSPHVSFVTCCHQDQPTKLRRDLHD